jgi:zinc D-Ala-D-Ala carboxypeptidase
MTHSAAARSTVRRSLRSIVIGLLVIGVAAIGILVSRSAGSSTRLLGAGPPPGALPLVRAAIASTAPSLATTRPRATPRGRGAITEEDGLLPDGVTVFDAAYPGIAKLRPALLEALREAASDAAGDGISFTVNSGWRSTAYQDRLLREAVSQYGSAKEAARWVATADTSPHVSGDAVDIGSADAIAWLARHGARYGLCPIYRNEPWHYELRATTTGGRCPRPYADPTHDPRMGA